MARRAPLSVAFPRQGYWSGLPRLPCPSQGDLPDPGIEPAIRARQVDSILLRHLGSPAIHIHVSVLLQWFCLLDSTAAAAEGSCGSQRERVLAGETCRAESIGPCPSPACKPPSSAPYWQGLQNTCRLRTM